MKKIVVRAPNWLGDITMSLPFFLLLPKVFPSAEIHIIVKPEYEGLMKLLPYKLETHTFTKKEHPGLRGMFGFKKQNLQLLSADLYFALPPSFSSALMGKVLGARERVGFKSEGRSLFLSRSYVRPKRCHRADVNIIVKNSYLIY